jgi:hypothetical protein
MSITVAIILNIVLDAAVVVGIVGLLGWAIATQSRDRPIPGWSRDPDFQAADRRHRTDPPAQARRPVGAHTERRRIRRRSLRA